MVTSAIYELRRRGGGIGVLSMCAGGGMGAAMVIEVVEMTNLITEGLFRVDGERAVLLGSRRASTGVAKFPAERPELFDANPDIQADIEPIELSTEGTLYTFTTQEFAPPLPYKGNRDAKTFKPYVVGFIELPEGLLVETLIIDVSPAISRSANRWSQRPQRWRQKTGETFTTFAFRPV